LEEDQGFMKSLNNWMSKPVNSLKFFTDKFGELEIGNKLINTGNVIAETGSSWINMGTELTVKINSFIFIL
jgi:hypothetical protein